MGIAGEASRVRLHRALRASEPIGRFDRVHVVEADAADGDG